VQFPRRFLCVSLHLCALASNQVTLQTVSPRWTGDGYYESVVLDPDGNQVELMV